MSDKCLRSLLQSTGVESAVWLFYSCILDSQDFHMHPTNCIFQEQKGILIRYEFSIKFKTWRTLISSFSFFNYSTTGAEWKQEYLLIDSVLFFTFGDLLFNQQRYIKRWNEHSNNNSSMVMMIFLLQATAAESFVCLKIKHSVSPPHFSVCRTQCCLKLAHYLCVSLGQGKHNILGSKLSLGWNERWNPLPYFRLHLLCPTRTCYRGK